MQMGCLVVDLRYFWKCRLERRVLQKSCMKAIPSPRHKIWSIIRFYVDHRASSEDVCTEGEMDRNIRNGLVHLDKSGIEDDLCVGSGCVDNICVPSSVAHEPSRS